MPTPPPDNVFDKLARALAAVDPAGNPYGDHQLKVGGTINILGGGAGGTSMTDDSTFQPGASSVTPAGAYVGGRQVASGHVGAPAMSNSAILQVHVVAGGAGGGVANLTVKGTANNDVNVGVASGNAGAAGNWALPVVYASGAYQTVNLGAGVYGSVNVVGAGGSLGVVGAGGSLGAVNLGGSVGVVPLATFTVALDKIPTVNLGLGTVNIGNAPQVTGSAWVTPAGDFTVWLANAAGGGGGFATVGVYGSVGMVGSVRATNLGGSVGVIGAGGSMGVTQIGAPWAVQGSAAVTPAGDFTVWLANLAAGNGFATVGVYGSVGVTGSVRVTPAGDFTVWLANLAAGNGFATVGVYGSVGVTGSVWATNLGGSVGVVGAGGSLGVTQIGAPWSVVGSAFVTNLGGSVGVVGAGGSLGAVNLGGSVGVTQLGAPWSVVGSVGVTPLATFTVALDKIPTVNLGLGTVNVGNVVTATLPAVTVIDTRGSLTATTWPISFGGSGYSAIAVASLAGGVRAKLHSIVLVNTGTCDLSFQSPSGTFLTGSMRILPGAGFAAQTQLGNPVLIGGSNATLFVHAAGTQNVGGWVTGWVEAG